MVFPYQEAITILRNITTPASDDNSSGLRDEGKELLVVKKEFKEFSVETKGRELCLTGP